MRKRRSFLLTVFENEMDPSSFCGQVKVVASGKTFNFTSMDELRQIISKEMDEEALKKAIQHEIYNKAKGRTVSL